MFAARLTQADLASENNNCCFSKKTDCDEKLKKLNKNLKKQNMLKMNQMNYQKKLKPYQGKD